jgi:mRNA interferase RelE/StbE
VSWKIALTPAARQMLTSVSDRRIREKLAERIDHLAQSPEQQGKPLVGELRGIRSLRAIGQRYRILYRLERDKVLVLVVAVGLRKGGDQRDIYALAKKLLRLGLLS